MYIQSVRYLFATFKQLFSCVIGKIPKRLNIGLMLFFTTFFLYVLRSNLSINMVAMVQSNAVDENGTQIVLPNVKNPYHLQCNTEINTPHIELQYITVWSQIQLDGISAKHHSGRLFLRIRNHVDSAWYPGRQVRLGQGQHWMGIRIVRADDTRRSVCG